MILSSLPVFSSLPLEEQERLLSIANRITLSVGKALFYEGDPADKLYVLTRGECALSWGEESRGGAQGVSLLDPVAVLGGLPQSLKVTAVTDCELLYWAVDDLWKIPEFTTAARRHLAGQLQQAQTRLGELTAPLHYLPDSPQLMAGPFRLDNVTMIFAFCEANRPFIEDCLPPSLSLLQRPGRSTAPVLVALAKFPKAYPEDKPDARFAYTETTFFIPIRYGTALGFFVPFIYPSTWEPILLGREIYGFPKQLGETRFSPNTVSLSVDNTTRLNLTWQVGQASDEPRLVRALADWLGLEGRITSAAFQTGEVLRKLIRLPPFRRVDVYNRKRIPAADTSLENPKYDLDQLTRATFGVLRWYQITRLGEPQLAIQGERLPALTLREAYRTQLDLRLSAGRVILDYR